MTEFEVSKIIETSQFEEFIHELFEIKEKLVLLDITGTTTIRIDENPFLSIQL